MAVWKWTDDRIGISDLVGPSMKHLVPRDAKWWYVFGSATMLAFIVQVVTGVALAFCYVSSSSQAYETLQFITNEAPFGRILRDARFQSVPMILETPKGMEDGADLDAVNLGVLRRLEGNVSKGAGSRGRTRRSAPR